MAHALPPYTRVQTVDAETNTASLPPHPPTPTLCTWYSKISGPTPLPPPSTPPPLHPTTPQPQPQPNPWSTWYSTISDTMQEVPVASSRSSVGGVTPCTAPAGGVSGSNGGSGGRSVGGGGSNPAAGDTRQRGDPPGACPRLTLRLALAPNGTAAQATPANHPPTPRAQPPSAAAPVSTPPPTSLLPPR